uniref:Uncharacterized protein n=1 Tax=Avena sativa TaxID=4498 RepID=A0ACD5X2A3_AVESA
MDSTSMTSDKRRRLIPLIGASMLPDELMTEVLLRLPVKSILRFRAVCRSWAAVLSSEEFCSLHMAKAETEAAVAPPKLIFISPTPSFDSTRVYSGSSSDPDDGLLFSLNGVRGDFADMTPAPCWGLTLLHDLVAQAYYVFNVATRAVTRLPPYQHVLSCTAALGFDSRTKEYKVVRLCQGISDEKQRIKCEVYVLGGGENGDRWRSAAGGVPFRFWKFVSAAVATVRWSERELRPVFADGFLHWLIDPATMPTRPKAVALSFSVKDETFRLVRSPPFEVSRSGVHLVELGGHLCMVRDLRPHGSMLEIWKIKDYSSGDWSLEHSIDLLQHVERDLTDPQVIRVIGSVGDYRSGEKVILVTSKRKAITYDPVSGILKTILSIRETSSSYETKKSAPRVSLFKESLAPVHKTNEEIALSSPLAKAVKEILFRLPADFAVQLKLVSKQWLRLIGSESFMSAYYAHNNMDMRPKIMFVGNGAGGLGFSFAPLKKLLREVPSQGTWLNTKVVCSKPCHGMNLVSTEMEDYLYNPSTGYHCSFRTRVPLYDVPDHVLVMMRGNACTPENHAFAVGNKNVGLGFNLLTQEHVIVQTLYHLKDFNSRAYFLTCSVITPCSEQDQFEPPLPLNGMPPAYLSGVLYWMSEPRLGQSYKRAIVSFDIARQTFSIIPCPPCIAMWNDTSPCQAFVVELEGTLCVVLADPVAEELDIWKLEHDGWDRAYKVYLEGWLGYWCYSLGANVVVPLAVDPKDGRILLSTGKKLGLYDPVRRTIENLYDLDEVLRLEQQHTFLDKLPNKHCSGEVPFRRENPLESKILPWIPLLYEESLASYPREPIARPLGQYVVTSCH